MFDQKYVSSPYKCQEKLERSVLNNVFNDLSVLKVDQLHKRDIIEYF